MRVLTRVNPTANLNDVNGRLNRLFGDFLGAPVLLANGAPGRATFVPALDGYETSEHVVVTMELAGVDPSTLDISVSGDELMVRGEKPPRELPENTKHIHSESAGGAFSRSISIPVAFDAEAISAEARHGVLTIRLPKRAEILPKQIEIQVE